MSSVKFGAKWCWVYVLEYYYYFYNTGKDRGKGKYFFPVCPKLVNVEAYVYL